MSKDDAFAMKCDSQESTAFLEGVGPKPRSSVWQRDRYRQPVVRLIHKGEENHHGPNDWHMICYDDGTTETRHAPSHPWGRAYMALERIHGGSLRDYVNIQLTKGWAIHEGRFEREPRVFKIGEPVDA